MPSAAPRRNIARLIERRVPSHTLGILRTVTDLAAERGAPLYLVGGVVRDLLLGRETLDLDLVVEGDAQGLARDLALRLGGRAVAHDQFGTAKLTAGALTIDLAMARLERYARPGALPEVRPGSLDDDLRRRDFTINAIAVALAPGPFGQLIDPLGGRADLRARLIRVLHDRSFVDDPTRLLRALRYQARFRFRLEERTRELLLRDAGGLAQVSSDRVRHELQRTLEEGEPERALQAAQETGVLAAVHPALAWRPGHARWFARARAEGIASPSVYLALLTHGQGEDAAAGVARRLALPNDLARPLLDAQRLQSRLHHLADPGMRPSQLYDALSEYQEAAIAACRLAADSPIIEARLRLYLERLRNVRPELDGRGLIELGVPQGPAVGAALAALRRARLDGEVQTRDDETAYVRRWAASKRAQAQETKD